MVIVIYTIGMGLFYFTHIYTYILLGRIILSFFHASFYANPTLANFYRVLYGLTEPVLAPIRQLVPMVRMGMGYLDLSPLILLILLSLLRQFILMCLR